MYPLLSFHPEEQQSLLVPDDYSSRRYQGGMVRLYLIEPQILLP